MMRSIANLGLRAEPVALGTWAIGGGPWWGETSKAEAISAVRASVEHGVTLIDTAPAYGLGRSEAILGEAIQGIRDQVIIATKCGIWWEDARGIPAFEVEGAKAKRSLHPDTIRSEIDMSLSRLKIDHIDIYQTHWPVTEDPSYSIADTVGTLMDLKREGKIGAIGACNVSVSQIQEYLSAGQLDVVQLKYSMLDRGAGNEIVPFCQDHSIAILAYSPLEQGLLTGKIGMDYELSADSSRNNIPWFKPENRKRVLDLLHSWNDLTEKYGCNLSQLAIAWTINQPGVTFALCGARTQKHASENASALELQVASKDLSRMNTDILSLGKAR